MGLEAKVYAWTWGAICVGLIIGTVDELLRRWRG
jgi:hypothetical protein